MLRLILLLLSVIAAITLFVIIAEVVVYEMSFKEAINTIKNTLKCMWLLLILPSCVKIENNASKLDGLYYVEETITYSSGEDYVTIKQDTIHITEIATNYISIDGRIQCSVAEVRGPIIRIPNRYYKNNGLEQSMVYSNCYFYEKDDTIYIEITENVNKRYYDSVKYQNYEKICTLICKKIK